ncbi:hypothetical protein J5N97_018699 [Dioscorea zingiberensis]|uniref:FLZ-type domain-containing protein n=1 Tax=Dioscorea zingiberensis TaxID=325984 RepID=A0A9D5HC05_9LILI|nr:hypothetical protein J5N97_018699 [Dioscorea zingiberensis]
MAESSTIFAPRQPSSFQAFLNQVPSLVAASSPKQSQTQSSACMGSSSFSSFSDLESGLHFMQRNSSYIKRPFISSTGSPSPRSVVTSMAFYDSFSDDELHHHFLDSCFLCHKTLNSNKDIFMYKGDTPFCSEACRQEQIELDESNDRKKKHLTMANNNKKQRLKNPRDNKRAHINQNI